MQTTFNDFCQLVLDKAELQEKLRDIRDNTQFISQVVAMGEKYGYQFTTEEVLAAMQTKRRAWIERWIR